VDSVQVGQGAIGAWDRVCEDDVDLTAELVEDLGESESGADGVAVGAGVGGKKEAGVGAEDGQERGDLGLMDLGLKLVLLDLGFWREGLPKVGGGSLKLQDLGFSCHDLAVTG
jgi:hypothetical protein